MTARDKPAPAGKTPQQLADDHDLRVIRARQRCQQIGYQGLNRWIDGYCHHKGDAEMTIYLDGGTQVRPSELTILEQPT